MDTETLLALVSSLLDRPLQDHSVILDALVQCEGDVERAAFLLNTKLALGDGSSNERQSLQTRKRPASLTAWLNSSPEKSVGGSRAEGDYAESSKRRKRSRSPSRPLQNTKPSSSKKPASTDGISALSTGSILPAGSPSKAKAVTNAEFLSILRPPNSSGNTSRQTPPKYPPLTLTTPEMVSKHTPCTMHTSILPPELACRLFYTMMDESKAWSRNQWWLFDRVVESPHRTSFYVRQGTSDSENLRAAQFWYNGRKTAAPAPFPSAMEEACEFVERLVNAEMRKRTRFPLEWGGELPDPNDDLKDGKEEDKTKIIWRANVAASNCYEGAKESVGFHTDQLTNLGPYPTIASLSLGTTRVFRLREVIPTDEKDQRSARTFNIPLSHNSLVIMHAPCQETFKHAIPPQRTIDLFHPPFPPPPTSSYWHPNDQRVQNGEEPLPIPPSNARINITFRFYRPDYRPSTAPECKCGIPCILRPDMKNRYALPTSVSDKDAGESSNTVREHEGNKVPSVRKDAVCKYWWTCYAGAQNEGKGCGYWKVMDVKAEGRGPFAGDFDGIA